MIIVIFLWTGFALIYSVALAYANLSYTRIFFTVLFSVFILGNKEIFK